MHDLAWSFVARAMRDIAVVPLRVVELGSRDVNGSVRPIFSQHQYTGVDIAPGPGVDVVCDGALFGDENAYDVGICCETLEHAPNAPAVVANLRRIVRRGGLIIITVATDPRGPHSAVDGGPIRSGEYYGNVQAAELIDWFDGCEYINVEIDRSHGDLRALVTNQ